MKITRMNLWEGGNTKGFFDIETEDGIGIKGFKIVEGQNGLFVSLPSSKGKDGKWYDNVFMSKEMRDKLNEMALNEYNQQTGNTASSSILDEDDTPF